MPARGEYGVREGRGENCRTKRKMIAAMIKVVCCQWMKKLFSCCLVPLSAVFPIVNHPAREQGCSSAVWPFKVVFQPVSTTGCVTETTFGRHPLLNLRQHRSCCVYPGWVFL